MENSKKCKYCQQDIDKKAKICPHCRKKQSKFPKWIIILLAFIVIIAVAVDSASEEAQKEKEKFSYEVTNEYTDAIGAHYIEGIVKNNNDKNYSYLQVEFVCYDKDGNNLGTALDNTNNLGANETWKFKAFLLSTNGTVDNCKYKEVTGW